MGAEHAAQAVELAALTGPGPFGLRTLELGDYVGVFDQGRLVAMAGERAFASPWREISGICTHPDFQGSGLAWRLTARLLRHQLARGEMPFLHVMSDDLGARSLYQRMGFRDYRESVVRVIRAETPCPEWRRTWTSDRRPGRAWRQPRQRARVRFTPAPSAPISNNVSTISVTARPRSAGALQASATPWQK